MLTGFVLFLIGVLAAPPGGRGVIVPDFRDLTIRIRSTMDSRHKPVTTYYFKGSRMRSEMQYPESENPTANVNIFQCDQGTRYLLGESLNTYISVPIDPMQRRETARPARELQSSGGAVTVTTDSVDTGKRRQIGSYQARHVKTTITVEPGPGAVSRQSTTEVDGWYLDLPGVYCQDTSARRRGWITVGQSRIDRVLFKQLGEAQRGFAVEETTNKNEGGHEFVLKTELLEISEKPLDESLFELPAGYSPAPPKAAP
jgi:Domain of unknown function (DUF4412)